jgi:hypothetical protein
MQRPSIWKALTLGAAVTGLALTGAGTALADSGAAVTAVQPVWIPAANAPIPLDPPWWDDDMIDWLDNLPVPDVPIGHIPDGPFWDDDWLDD